MHSFTRTLIATVATALLLSQGTASGQVPRPIGRATIPFGFQWNGMRLPSGQYTLNLDGPFVSMFDGHQAEMALSNVEQSNGVSMPSHIVFHCIAGQCFLREIWMSNSGYHLAFGKNKNEKQQRPLAGTTDSQTTDDPIVVALR